MRALPDGACCTSYGPRSAKLLLDADVAAASRHTRGAAMRIHETQLKSFFALDETIFTTVCARQLNSPRDNKRPMGSGYCSC